MSIAQRILQLRKEHNLTQEQLAAEIYVSRQTISKWESGQVIPDIDNIQTLCKYFDVTTDFLINGNVKDKTSKKGLTIDIIVLVIGMILLGICLIMMVINKDEFNELSSIIKINGYTFLAIFSIVMIVTAILLICKKRK